MAKKEYTPFPAIVCERLRNMLRLEKEARLKRDELFDARDNALEEYNNADEPAEKEKHAAEYGRFVMEIDRWNAAVKAIGHEKNNTIEHADEPGLYDEAKVQIKEFLPEPKPRADKDQMDLPRDARPVGRPEKEPNTLARAMNDGYVAPAAMDGTHVAEIGLNTLAVEELAHRGIDTIGDLVKAADSIKGFKGITPALPKPLLAAVENALKAWRKKAGIDRERPVESPKAEPPITELQDFGLCGATCREFVKAGFKTIAQLASWFDRDCPDGEADAVKTKSIEAAKVAVATYRKKHRGAAAKAEKESSEAR